jgi:hypothetical protein
MKYFAITVVTEATGSVIKGLKKIWKYYQKSILSIEIQRMWNMKCFVIPVIIGATVNVIKGLEKYLEKIKGKHSVDSLQKTSVLGTLYVTRKVLQSET